MTDPFIHTDKLTHDDIERFRAMSLDERGKLLSQACLLAARLERSRIESGLPPSEPVPWPESTWEMLRKSAAAWRAAKSNKNSTMYDADARESQSPESESYPR